MTETQYWDGDCNLVVFYRKSDEIKLERQNYFAWLQGMYVYDAIGRIAPVLHPYAKKGTKAIEYVNKPYNLFEKEEKDNRRALQFMEMFMVQTNKNMSERR